MIDKSKQIILRIFLSYFQMSASFNSFIKSEPFLIFFIYQVNHAKLYIMKKLIFKKIRDFYFKSIYVFMISKTNY